MEVKDATDGRTPALRAGASMGDVYNGTTTISDGKFFV
jgi:hypothetical protein